MDRTKECTKRFPHKRRHRHRRLDAVEMIVIHRSHLADTAVETARRFDDVKLGTGGKMPYHFFIQEDGTIEQALPLSVVGPGAMGVNRVAVQVAIHGDLRSKPPTLPQTQSLTKLCTELANWMGSCRIFGHTEIPGSSSDPLKECPGRRISMDGLREIVKRDLERWERSEANAKLGKKGYIL